MSEPAELPFPPAAVPDPHAVGGFSSTGALERARELGPQLPAPGGTHGQLRRTLSELGAPIGVRARIIEPHLDALAILRQAGLARTSSPTTTWPRGPRRVRESLCWPRRRRRPGAPARAASRGTTWTLTGTKAVVLAGRLRDARSCHAHVTDEHGEPTGHRRAFVVATDHPYFGSLRP
ncbi:hypothetical protein QJS66_10965 [Kocuria rhizophila]|nr:hypothetical protein QJS66_10965 [Kocuria rhizophila]